MRTALKPASAWARQTIKFAVGLTVDTVVLLSVVGCSMAPTLPEREVKFDQVPSEVRAAMQAKFPEATVLRIETQNYAGELVYEFTCRSADRIVEYLFAPGGRYVATAEDVLETELPVHVLGSFKSRYPGVTIQKARLETVGDGSSAQKIYECSFIRPDGVRVRVKYDQRGVFQREDLGQPLLAQPTGGAVPIPWKNSDIGGGPGMTSVRSAFRV